MIFRLERMLLILFSSTKKGCRYGSIFIILIVCLKMLT